MKLGMEIIVLCGDSQPIWEVGQTLVAFLTSHGSPLQLIIFISMTITITIILLLLVLVFVIKS